jgi:hypothetical protein
MSIIMSQTDMVRNSYKLAAKPKIYVASPYTQGDQALNVRLNIDMANRLVTAGYVPYCPLLTHFWHMLFPRPYQDWLDMDNQWLPFCDAVLRLKNHPDTGQLLPPSTGADGEEDLAIRIGLPVFYSLEELLLKFPPLMLCDRAIPPFCV